EAAQQCGDDEHRDHLPQADPGHAHWPNPGPAEDPSDRQCFTPRAIRRARKSAPAGTGCRLSDCINSGWVATTRAQSGVWVPGREAANSLTTLFLPAELTPLTVSPWIVGTTMQRPPICWATACSRPARISGYAGLSFVPASNTITDCDG